MNSIQQLKLAQFSANQKQTVSSIARSIAQLNNDLAAAVEHQAYARKNPDNIIDDGFLALMGHGVDQLLAQFAQTAGKRDDLLAVKSGAMSVDDLIAKYNINVADYSDRLI